MRNVKHNDGKYGSRALKSKTAKVVIASKSNDK
jgi:hypothetical protein